MENASKALIMAAEIAIGVILISFLVLGYYNLTNFSDSINSNIQDTNINEFNSQFTIYDGKTDLTVHDVVTIVNLANEYNLDKDNDEYKITIQGNAIKSIEDVINDTSGFIQENQDKKYTVKDIKLSDKTKLVKAIIINVNK